MSGRPPPPFFKGGPPTLLVPCARGYCSGLTQQTDTRALRGRPSVRCVSPRPNFALKASVSAFRVVAYSLGMSASREFVVGHPDARTAYLWHAFPSTEHRE